MKKWLQFFRVILTLGFETLREPWWLAQSRLFSLLNQRWLGKILSGYKSLKLPNDLGFQSFWRWSVLILACAYCLQSNFLCPESNNYQTTSIQTKAGKCIKPILFWEENEQIALWCFNMFSKSITLANNEYANCNTNKITQTYRYIIVKSGSIFLNVHGIKELIDYSITCHANKQTQYPGQLTSTNMYKDSPTRPRLYTTRNHLRSKAGRFFMIPGPTMTKRR